MHLRSHVAVWLDHHEARVFHLDLAKSTEETFRAPPQHVHRHPKGRGEAHAHPEDMKRFFAEVARAIAESDEILVTGPSTAKTQFVHYLHAESPKVANKIVAIETLDHPTDAQLVDLARRRFDLAPPRV